MHFALPDDFQVNTILSINKTQVERMNKKFIVRQFTVRQSIFSIPRYIMFNQGWNFDGIFNDNPEDKNLEATSFLG